MALPPDLNFPIEVAVKMIRLVFACLAALALEATVHAQESPLVQAMRDELARSMAGLRVPGQPAPYYIAYTVDDVAATRINATLGALVDNYSSRSRMVRVEVRVGDYARDSSRFVSFDWDPGVASMYAFGMIQGPIDDDVDVLRRQLWLVTDAAYKRALTVFARKQAALQNQVTADPIPDFSRETPQERTLPTAAPSVLGQKWADLVRDLSAGLTSPDLTSSEATLFVRQGARYFVNSEGFRTVQPMQSAQLSIVADTQADDGMPLRDAVVAYAGTPDKLPAVADLLARTRELAAGLLALRKAPVGDAYTGPVLVEGQAASELLAQTFVPLFLSLRAPEAENQQMMGPMMRASSTPFLTRVGAKVLPDGLSVMDTPSLARFGSQDVPGAYAVDDEGIPAQDVTLCDKGTLKSLLTSRTPQRGFLTSNGHGRGGFAQAGVFQLQSASPVPAARLRENYLARLKQDGRPFGYILRTLSTTGVAPSGDGNDMMESMMMMMGGPNAGPGGPKVVRAFKVTPDGSEVLVRGLQLGGVTHSTYREILDASEERTMYSYQASLPPQLRMMAMMPGNVSSDAIVSLIAPNLIFGELELEKPTDGHQRPPIVASPLK